jgi:hypothetical protein
MFSSYIPLAFPCGKLESLDVPLFCRAPHGFLCVSKVYQLSLNSLKKLQQAMILKPYGLRVKADLYSYVSSLLMMFATVP